jgi:CheY-like chemotaxis protein
LHKKEEKRYSIIIADDDIDDQFLISRAIEETNIKHTLFAVHNGLELINLLFKKDPADDKLTERPDLIVMDLNMPLLDGFGALKQIRAHAEMKDIPVYVLSTSRFEYDRTKSKELGATDFYTKPYHFDGLKGIIKEIFTNTVRSFNEKVR